MEDFSTSSGLSHPPVFCDWLDVTFPSDSPLWGELSDFLLGESCSAKEVKDGTIDFRHPLASWGSFQLLRSAQGWSRVSASGGSCAALRTSGSWADYLGLIGSYPHTVTRVDATLQVYVEAAPIIQRLVDQYPPTSLVHLTRKGVKPDYYLRPALYPGGGLTGTFYAGSLRTGSSKASARVYDKRNEQLDRRGVDIGPCTQFEVTGRKGYGVTLRDAYSPAPLFWHLASPCFLNRPEGVADWVPFAEDLWSPGRVDRDPYHRLVSRVSESFDLGALSALADQCGDDGRLQLLRLIRNRLGLDVSVTALTPA